MNSQKVSGFIYGLVLALAIAGCHFGHAAGSGGPTPAIFAYKATITPSAQAQTRSVQSFGGNTTTPKPAAVVTASGSPLGTVQGYAAKAGAGWQPNIQATATAVQILTDTGNYPVLYTRTGGFIPDIYSLGGSLYYPTNDCTGSVVYTGGGSISQDTANAGLVFRSEVGNDGDASTYFYLPIGSTLTTVDIGSQRSGNNGDCQSFSQPGLIVYPVLPNDETVTHSPSAPVGDIVVQ